jgi:hypothetical protein
MCERQKVENRVGLRNSSTAGQGASVNACEGQMLDINERLNSLAGYDMRDVTTADSDETTLNVARQLQHGLGIPRP